MGRKGIALLVSVLTMFQPAGFVWAGPPRILSDLELDSIHAGGLNFDFDKIVGSRATTAQGMIKSPMSPTKASDTVQPTAVNLSQNQTTSNYSTAKAEESLQRISSALNGYKSGKTSAAVIVPTTTPVSSSPATTQQPSAASAPLSSADAGSPSLPNVAVDGASNITTLADAMTPLTADPSVNTVANSLDSMAGSAPTSASTNNVSDASAGIAADSAVSSVSVPDSANRASDVGASPAVPQTAAASESPETTNVTADTVVNLNTATGEWDGVISNADGKGGLTIFETSQGTMNILNVTDSSQQNLSSMVNINAAGSIVNVQMNTLVMIDSTIESLTTSNSLDMSGFAAFSGSK